MKKPITLQNAVGKTLTNSVFSMFDQMLLVFGDEYVCLEHKRDDIEEDDLNLFDFGDDLLINAGILSADELSTKRAERDAIRNQQYEEEERANYERLKARFEENVKVHTPLPATASAETEVKP